MQAAVCLPYMELEELTRPQLRDWCRRIDQGPFSSLACGERVTGSSLEMRTLLSMAAAWTERVRIAATLYVLPMHSAVWAAKEIATLDQLSEGRVSLTVGVGGREMDYRAVGAPFARRHPRLDEQIATLRRTWAGEPPAEGCDPVSPSPHQPGGPPIYTGGWGPKSVARAARWADGIYAWSGNGNPEEVRAIYERADRAWEEAGRDTAPRRLAGFWYTLADDGEVRLYDYVYGYVRMFGDAIASGMAKSCTRHNADAVARALDGLEAEGCEEVFLVPATGELREVDGAAEILARRA